MGDFLAVYEPLIQRGADIVSIHICGGISGTVRSAEQARDQLVERGVAAERLVGVDSGSVCAGHGLMAVAAANATTSGADAAGAVRRALALREEVRILFAVDTLEFLRRGGRIGGAEAWIGSTLRIKPILSIECEIVRSSSSHLRPRVRADGRPPRVALREDGNDASSSSTSRRTTGGEARPAGEAMYGRPPEFVSEMGPVIGAHAGPGLIGVTALRSEILGPV